MTARPRIRSISVSDRDFVLETLSRRLDPGDASLALCRRNRDLDDTAIRLIALSDKFTTGSSIIAAEAQPDAAELVRAKTGRIFGAMIGLLTVMKGLALAYAKDMQEEQDRPLTRWMRWPSPWPRPPAWCGTWSRMARRLRMAAGSGYATATDLADWLVRSLSMPFREAHHVTGRIVGLARHAALRWENSRWPRCRASSRRSPRRFSTFSG